MRLFAAIPVPVDEAAHLDEHLDGLRTSRPDLRWSAPSRWHITLQFLGECGPHEVDRQLDRWERRALRGRSMTLQLAGSGTFPQATLARTFWAGVAGELDALRQVAAADQQPHVTLARTREATDLTGPVLELARYAGPTFAVGQLSLLQSHLRSSGERGPRYEVLESFQLGGAGAAGSFGDDWATDE